MEKNLKGVANNPLFVMKRIHSSELKILGEDYQRTLNANRVAKIVADFNERIANEPKVSERDGKYYVFDGQHTIAARKFINGGDLPILCKVYTGLTEQDEAFLFALQTGTSAKPTSGERMRAWLFGEDEEALDFKRATESAGIYLELGEVPCDYRLKCINTAFDLYRRFGEDVYVDALNIIVDAWDGDHESLKVEMLIAITYFIWLYHDVYDRNKLVSRLRNHKPIDIRKAIKRDLDYTGRKKNIHQIYQIYNGRGKPIIPCRF